jgi:DeoR/GlpR family transcriptional regulator of sugar metabolism
MTVSRELSKYKLDLVGVQVRREAVAPKLRKNTRFSTERHENHELRAGLFCDKRIISAVEIVEFVSDMMSYIILRGRWCHFIVHALTEDKTDDVKKRDNIRVDFGEVV